MDCGGVHLSICQPRDFVMKRQHYILFIGILPKARTPSDPRSSKIRNAMNTELKVVIQGEILQTTENNVHELLDDPEIRPCHLQVALRFSAHTPEGKIEYFLCTLNGVVPVPEDLVSHFILGQSHPSLRQRQLVEAVSERSRKLPERGLRTVHELRWRNVRETMKKYDQQTRNILSCEHQRRESSKNVLVDDDRNSEHLSGAFALEDLEL